MVRVPGYLFTHLGLGSSKQEEKRSQVEPMIFLPSLSRGSVAKGLEQMEFLHLNREGLEQMVFLHLNREGVGTDGIPAFKKKSIQIHNIERGRGVSLLRGSSQQNYSRS